MDIEHLDKWRFGGTQSTADFLLRLVLDGKKTATSSSLPGYEKENAPCPRPGHTASSPTGTARPAASCGPRTCASSRITK